MRGDLPGYLTDSEADGVIVINWYHRQFIQAAKDRYFKTTDDFKYFHRMMSEFFLGMWGGGTPKPFKFTEIQKHRFGLKSKEDKSKTGMRMRMNFWYEYEFDNWNENEFDKSFFKSKGNLNYYSDHNLINLRLFLT